VVTNNGPQEPPRGSADPLGPVPPMPVVPLHQLYRGAPVLLADGQRHSAGWQEVRKAGPGFVVTTRGLFGANKVLQRFPLTEQGWADAWQLLSGLDAGAAAVIEARLAKLEARRQAAAALAAVDARSVCYLPRVTFDGGSGSGPLVKGQRYDLRFQDDRIVVCPQDSAQALVDVPYAEIANVEVSKAASQPASTMLGWISGLGLLGAFFGFLVLRLPGLLLGAVVLGLVGGVIAAATSKDEAIVLIRGRDAEFQFLDLQRRADELQRALSEPLMAIRRASATQADKPGEAAGPTPDSVADQLSKLASLLQQDLITRDEFEHLKAKVIATS
jgi:hypothetical protein